MRTIITGDAFEVLPTLPRHDAVCTSLPDAAELGMPLDEWAVWFVAAATLCLDATPPAGLTAFYQTDRKGEGRWTSKAGLLIGTGRRLLWHKVVLRRDPGATDLFRPGYSHLLAFSEQGRPGKATPDVLAPSRALSPNGMPVAAARMLAGYARGFGDSLVDPFCGPAPLLAVAEWRGFDRITGIEIDPGIAAAARRLVLPGP